MKNINNYILEKLNVKDIKLDSHVSLSKLNKNLINSENEIDINSFCDALLELHNQNYKYLIFSINGTYFSLGDDLSSVNSTIFRKSKLLFIPIIENQYNKHNIHDLYIYLLNVNLVHFENNNASIAFNTGKIAYKDMESTKFIRKDKTTIVLQIITKTK